MRSWANTPRVDKMVNISPNIHYVNLQTFQNSIFPASFSPYFDIRSFFLSDTRNFSRGMAEHAALGGGGSDQRKWSTVNYSNLSCSLLTVSYMMNQADSGKLHFEKRIFLQQPGVPNVYQTP